MGKLNAHIISRLHFRCRESQIEVVKIVRMKIVSKLGEKDQRAQFVNKVYEKWAPLCMCILRKQIRLLRSCKISIKLHARFRIF